LRYLNINPGLLDRMILTNPFYGGDLPTHRPGDLKLTGPHRLSVHVYRTGAALGNTATELGTAELEIFPDHPKQGDIRFRLNGVGLAVNFESYGLSHKSLLSDVLTRSDERMDDRIIGRKVASHSYLYNYHFRG
jgi:hypothetical protein